MTTSARMWLISAGSRETAPTQQAATTARAFPGTRRRDGPSSRPTMAPNASVTSGSLRPLRHCSDMLNSRFCACLLPCWRWNFFYACPPGWAAPSSPPDISVLRQNSRIVAKTKKKKESMKRGRFAGFWSWFMNISCIFHARWNHSLSSKRNYTVFGMKWGWLSLLLGTVLLLFFTHLQADILLLLLCVRKGG